MPTTRQRDIMNSRNVRRHIGTATLVVIVLFVSPSLFAQIHVKVKTPGTAFSPGSASSVVPSKARVDDLADGRHFRAAEITSVDPTTGKKVTYPVQHEELYLRGVLRMPPSDSRVPTTHQMQRMAIHFRTSERGPTLISVKLCNAANCDTFGTDLAGDYSTREVTTPKGAKTRSTDANVWAFDPPRTVDSHSTVVLRTSVRWRYRFCSR